ncbi:MarR family winged helix-turn-helix transcriptional regulator [Cellulomonas fimi]|uniref:MarR family transcriptional regulator n=1 Tax=Cellulomonas fimi TaxID=1708 RepID=A0A7Y0M1D1_CELFI|nr:MarR family transcriptional regulator [Cellulomonas fimi]NMR21268.1 MarR family transcriptional regulator [Cellulomonas fimi]
MTHAAMNAWESLLRAQITLMKEFAVDFRGGPVTMPEYDVLYTLTGFAGGQARLRDVAHNVRLSQPGLSRLVERMESDGLVHRTRDPADGRGTLVALTDRGRELQRRMGRIHARAIIERVGSSLEPGELEDLERLCTKLRLAGSEAGAEAESPDEDTQDPDDLDTEPLAAAGVDAG